MDELIEELPEDDLPDEEEFSLDKLSDAYAEVRRQQEEEREGNQDEQLDLNTEAESDDLSTADQTARSNVPAEPFADDVEPESMEDDDAACPVSPDSIVEAILFVGAPKDVKLSGKKIASVLRDVSPKEVGQIVKKLNQRYQQENSAIRIDAQRGVYQMVLDTSLRDLQDEYFGRNREARLAQAAIDVLAVVAYHQPIAKDRVNEIRGKSSGTILKQLINRNLIQFVLTDAKSSGKQYKTTDRFLDLFRLNEIGELPQSHEVSEVGLD